MNLTSHPTNRTKIYNERQLIRNLFILKINAKVA